MKKSSVFCVSAFLLFIVAAAVITFVRPKDTYSYYENRNLSAFPERTAEAVSDGSYFSAIETYCIDHAAGRNTILKLKTAFDTLVGRLVISDVVVTDDVLLDFKDYDYESDAEVDTRSEWYARKLSELTDIIEGYGGYYCYVGVPCQTNYYADKYPSYLENHEKRTDIILSTFTKYMNEYGVNFLDMGAVAEENGNPVWFSSTTDNHYSLMGAYLTYTSIIDKINRDTGMSLTYPLEEDGGIVFEKLPNRYLGSRERKLFGLSRIRDSLYIASFADDIPFTRYDSGNLMDSYVYALPPDEWTQVLYSLYMGGDCPETVIETSRPDLPDILIYGDSFTNAVECLAYYSFDTMYSIDLRHYKDMTLAEFIELKKPDIVIGIRDYEDLITPYLNGDVFGLLPVN
ncbi:MAG: hypothetical protein E7672_07105 [Ruminococcaceae bacterium]|nr:hypothetical protein [Oscillospiraceae bacterium]